MGVVMLRTLPIVLLSFYYYEFEFTTGTKIRSVACAGALLRLTWCVTFRFSPTLSVIEKPSALFVVAHSDPLPVKHLVKGCLCETIVPLPQTVL